MFFLSVPLHFYLKKKLTPTFVWQKQWVVDLNLGSGAENTPVFPLLLDKRWAPLSFHQWNPLSDFCPVLTASQVVWNLGSFSSSWFLLFWGLQTCRKVARRAQRTPMDPSPKYPGYQLCATFAWTLICAPHILPLNSWKAFTDICCFALRTLCVLP